MEINGEVTSGKYAYQRKTLVEPTAHYYGNTLTGVYIKYSCPICDMLENYFNLPKGVQNCPQCNVNLTWEGLT